MSNSPAEGNRGGGFSGAAAAGPGIDPPTTNPIADQIDAEIADHLATASEQLQSSGVAAEEARQISRDRFGDATAIRRRCYWIKQGDALMFRWAVIGLLVAVCLVFALTTVITLRSQRQMAEEMAALAAQMQVMAEGQLAAQRAAPAPAAAALEITGKLYVGSPQRPAAFQEVKICKASDGEVIRRLPSGEDGRFSSGPLPAGDYFVLSTAATGSPSVSVQSGPILLYPSTPGPSVALDVSYPSGRLAIEFSRPLDSFEVNGSRLQGRVLVKVVKPRLWSEEWTSGRSLPAAWPLYVSGVSYPNRKEADAYPRLWFFDLLGNDEIASGLKGTLFDGEEGRLPSGNCVVLAQVILQQSDPRPAREEPVTGKKSPLGEFFNAGHPMNRVPLKFTGVGPYALRDVNKLPNETFSWVRGYFDQVRADLRSSGRIANGWSGAIEQEVTSTFSQVDGEGSVAVPITAGQATRIRIEIPDDLESQIARAADRTIAEPSQGAEAWKDNPMLRTAGITVLGSEPLAAP